MGSNVSYIISGLRNPGTVIEVIGSVYFINNMKYAKYTIDKVTIEDGWLCILFSPNSELPGHLKRPGQYSLKLKAGESVSLIIMECISLKDDVSMHVSLYCIESMFTPAQGYYFRFRIYKKENLDCPSTGQILHHANSAWLTERGFICVDEYDDDGKGATTVYMR